MMGLVGVLVWLLAIDARLGFLSGCFSAALEDCTALGVVGVFGSGDLAFLGECFGGTIVFAVEIGAGFVVVLLDEAFAGSLISLCSFGSFRSFCSFCSFCTIGFAGSLALAISFVTTTGAFTSSFALGVPGSLRFTGSRPRVIG